MSNKWDKRYLDIAKNVASWSKDPSTKVGAVIVAPGNKPISFGFNGFPRGQDDNTTLYEDKDYKHRHVIHAEENAIINARQSVEDCSIFVTHPPCQHCAGLLVQAGIKRVVFNELNAEFYTRWRLTDSLMIFKKADIEVTMIKD